MKTPQRLLISILILIYSEFGTAQNILLGGNTVGFGSNQINGTNNLLGSLYNSSTPINLNFITNGSTNMTILGNNDSTNGYVPIHWCSMEK